MHSHRYSWHNNELLERDAVQMISRLSAERVQREGYMNMRCHWDPGCPDWIHPGTIEENDNKREEILMAKAWTEIFPLDPIPSVLAQPCCGQFAISRDRIRSIPLATFIYYRDWLLNTPLSDYISGRVWEYVWQYMFTGNTILCPRENVCYCDGFGVCFGGEEKYDAYWELDREKKRLEEELKGWTEKKDKFQELTQEGRFDEANKFGAPEQGKDRDLEEKIEKLKKECEGMKLEAKKHGDVAKHRAEEAGREWKDGDGF